MNRISFALTALALSSSVACAGSVSGAVDEDGVPGMMSSTMVNASVNAIFTQVDTVQSTWVSFGDYCSFQAADLHAVRKGDARDREDLYKERTPKDWWSVVVSISAPDADDADGATLDLSGGNDDNISFSLTVCHNKDFPEEKDGHLEFDQDCFSGTNGDVDIAYDRKNGLSASGPKIDLEDKHGDDAGRVGFSGSASLCPDADDEFEEIVP